MIGVFDDPSNTAEVLLQGTRDHLIGFIGAASEEEGTLAAHGQGHSKRELL